MAKSRGGLGRGLAALIPTGPNTDTVSTVVLGGSAASPSEEKIRPGAGSDPGGHAEADDGEGTGDTSGTDHTTRADDTTGKVDTTETVDRAGADTTLVPGPESDHEGAAGTDNPGAEATPPDPGPRYQQVRLDQIRPNPKNPRTVFDPDALDELAHSIREFGLLQPVVVRPVEGGYELVMGERRWRAAQQAGVDTIDAIVRRTEDANLLRDALLENIHRSNLNPLEEAAAYQQLLDEFDVTHEELATRIGRSRPVISNTIRLLNLPVAVQRRVAAGVLSAGHARALLSLDDPGAQEELAARIVAEGLSVRGTEEAVTLLGHTRPRRNRPGQKKMSMPGVEDLANRLSDVFDTRVRVDLGRRKGKIVVEFATVDDLERIVAVMAPEVSKTKGG